MIVIEIDIVLRNETWANCFFLLLKCTKYASGYQPFLPLINLLNKTNSIISTTSYMFFKTCGTDVMLSSTRDTQDATETEH